MKSSILNDKVLDNSYQECYYINNIEERGSIMCKTINSLTELVQAILDNRRKQIDLKKNRNENGIVFYDNERTEFLFRGQSNEDYKLVPSLGRDKCSEFDQGLIDNERNLIEKAKFLLPDVFKNDMTPLELLALLQHHGIYTRLMDVTENPLVALYFACCSNPNDNGEFFIFIHNNFQISNLPIMNAIADSYKIMLTDHEMKLTEFYHKANRKNYFIDNYGEHTNDNDGATWIEKVCSKPFFVHAPMRKSRQKMQYSRYILFPNKIGNSIMESSQKVFKPIIEPIPKDDPCIKERFIIPSSAKNRIMAELRVFGISKEILFCDNTDVVCEGILNEYKNN